jgi:hypothetical protein
MVKGQYAMWITKKRLSGLHMEEQSILFGKTECYICRFFKICTKCQKSFQNEGFRGKGI